MTKRRRAKVKIDRPYGPEYLGPPEEPRPNRREIRPLPARASSARASSPTSACSSAPTEAQGLNYANISERTVPLHFCRSRRMKGLQTR